jgi:hypothetical protein
MLETYFSSSKLLVHLRSGPSGPYLDGFAAALERQGYSADTAVRYLRAAAHLGHVVARQGALPNCIDLAVFSEHLCICRCPRAMGGRGNHHTIFGQALSPAPCRNRRLPVRRGITASRAVPGGSLQNLAAQAPRGIRLHHQTLRPRRYPLDCGTRGRTRRVGTGRYSQLFPRSRKPLRQWNRREVDDQHARVLAVSRCQRPLRAVSPMLFLAMPIGGLPTRRAIWSRSR